MARCASNLGVHQQMAKEDVCVYIYTHTHTQWNTTQLLKKKLLPFAITWMDLKGIMLSEMSQRKTNTVCYHLYVDSKKEKLVNITKKKQTHRYREQTSGYCWGEGKGEGQDRGRESRSTNYYV